MNAILKLSGHLLLLRKEHKSVAGPKLLDGVVFQPLQKLPSSRFVHGYLPSTAPTIHGENTAAHSSSTSALTMSAGRRDLRDRRMICGSCGFMALFLMLLRYDWQAVGQHG